MVMGIELGDNICEEERQEHEEGRGRAGKKVHLRNVHKKGQSANLTLSGSVLRLDWQFAKNLFY
jgi:hypothetical protein